MKIIKISTLLAILLLTNPATANTGAYSFSFNDTSLKKFIMTVASIMNYTVSIDNRVNGKVNVRSYDVITKEELLDIFHNQLYMNGFVALQKNNSLRIVPAELAKTQPETLVISTKDHLLDDSIHNMAVVTLSFKVDLDVKNIIKIIKPMLDTTIGAVSFYESGNNLIITDRKQNLLRIIDIINDISINAMEEHKLKFSTHNINYVEGKKLTEQIIAFIAKQSDEHLKSVTLFFDEISNTIIIKGTVVGIDSVRGIISAIDVKPKQILVEAIILELESENTSDLGIDHVFGTEGLAIKAKGLLKINNGTNGSNWSAILNIIKKNNKTNLLSTPSIVVVSNKKAEFLSGSDIPIIASTSEKDGKETTTIKRQEIGVKLIVTPRAIKNNVFMKISQEISSAIEQTADSTKDGKDKVPKVIINKRKIESTVNIPNGEIIVLSGLYAEKDKKKLSGLPILSDIPFLGLLFGRTKITKTKSSLFIFLRTTILNDHNLKQSENILNIKQKIDNDKYNLGINGEPKKKMSIKKKTKPKKKTTIKKKSKKK